MVKTSIFVLSVVLLIGMTATADPTERRRAPLYPTSLDVSCATPDNLIKNDGSILAAGDAHAEFDLSFCSGRPG